MIVDAEIYAWTPTGMRRTTDNVGYVTTRELERLLEEAHERGRRAVLASIDADQYRNQCGG